MPRRACQRRPAPAVTATRMRCWRAATQITRCRPSTRCATAATVTRSMMNGYLSSEHARALFVVRSRQRAGLHRLPRQRPRHPVRRPTPRRRPPTHSIPETCGKCHTGILRQWQRERARRAVAGRASTERAGLHDLPSGARDQARRQRAAMRKRLPERLRQLPRALLQVVPRQLPRQGRRARLHARPRCAPTATRRTTTCRPRTRARASTPRNLATTCGTCHQGEVNASFLTFDPHADPHDPKRNPLPLLGLAAA